MIKLVHDFEEALTDYFPLSEIAKSLKCLEEIGYKSSSLVEKVRERISLEIQGGFVAQSEHNFHFASSHEYKDYLRILKEWQVEKEKVSQENDLEASMQDFFDAIKEHKSI